MQFSFDATESWDRSIGHAAAIARESGARPVRVGVGRVAGRAAKFPK